MNSRPFKVSKFSNRSGGSDSYRVSGTINGKQIRKNFATRAEALGEKQLLEIQRLNRSEEVKVVATRLTLAQTREAEAAFRLLDGRVEPLSFVVNFFLENYRAPQLELSLAEALEKYFAAKRVQQQKKQLSFVQLKGIQNHLKAFRDAHPDKKLGEISTQTLKAFLSRQHDWAPKTWNNERSYLSTFFNFCRDQDWLLISPATRVPFYPVKKARGIAETLSAEQARELMRFVETYTGGKRSGKRGIMVNFVALCLFAGIRPDAIHGEIRKLRPEHIRREVGMIFVDPTVSKVNEMRKVEIQPNLARWLERYPFEQYPIWPTNARGMIGEIHKELKLGYDVLRHTFISMHVARFRSVGDTALQAGNSEAVIRRHYLDVKTPEEADLFWNILPLAN